MGKLKLKGCYAIDREWHKDHSSLVVQKAVVDQMVHGGNVTHFILNHKDAYDFMNRGKVNRDSSLHMVYQDGTEKKLANTIRYYMAKEGGRLIKRTASKGVPGTWKRKTKLTDEYYAQVIAEITGQPGNQDSAGVPHDERIHTKNKSRWPSITETGIASGQLVEDCSNADHFDWDNVNYQWYIAEAFKLLIM